MALATPAVSFDADGGVSFGLTALRRSRALRHAVGQELVASADRAFAAQRAPDGAAWLARAVPNVAGIVRDVAAGRAPGPARFLPRPALTDTGRLQASVSYRLEGGRVVPTVGASYGMLHQQGGTSTIDVDPSTRAAVLRWLARARLGATLRAKVAGAVARHPLRTTVPARPFLGADRAARRRIRALVLKATAA